MYIFLLLLLESSHKLLGVIFYLGNRFADYLLILFS